MFTFFDAMTPTMAATTVPTTSHSATIEVAGGCVLRRVQQGIAEHQQVERDRYDDDQRRRKDGTGDRHQEVEDETGPARIGAVRRRGCLAAFANERGRDAGDSPERGDVTAEIIMKVDKIAYANGQKRGHRPADSSRAHQASGASEPLPVAVRVVFVAHQPNENHLGDKLRHQHPGNAKYDRQRQFEIARLPIGIQGIEQIRAEPDERAVDEARRDPQGEVLA